jgi:hypothetical protein
VITRVLKCNDLGREFSKADERGVSEESAGALLSYKINGHARSDPRCEFAEGHEVARVEAARNSALLSVPGQHSRRTPSRP